MQYIILVAVVAVIALFPYIRVSFMRIILLNKVKIICKKKNLKFFTPDLLSVFADGSKKFNFAIKHNKRIYAVSLFSSLYRHTALTIGVDGKMSTMRSVPGVFRAGQNDKPHVIRTSGKRLTLPDTGVFSVNGQSTDVQSLIVFCPPYAVVRTVEKKGETIKLKNGDRLLDALMLSPGGLLEMIFSLSENDC